MEIHFIFAVYNKYTYLFLDVTSFYDEPFMVVIPISMMCAKVKRLRCKVYIISRYAFGYLNDMNYLWGYIDSVYNYN